MKLIDLMVRRRIPWYSNASYAAQDRCGSIWFYIMEPKLWPNGNWSKDAVYGNSHVLGLPVAEDWNSCVINKELYDSSVRRARNVEPVLAPPPEHPDVFAFKKWYAETLPVIEAKAAGAEIETDASGDWRDKKFGSFTTSCNYRIKPQPPKTINIKGYEVPEPLRVVPDKGTYVYIAGIYTLLAEHCFKWDNGILAMCALKAGVLHLTREAAEVHSRALASSTQEGD